MEALAIAHAPTSIYYRESLSYISLSRYRHTVNSFLAVQITIMVLQC